MGRLLTIILLAVAAFMAGGCNGARETDEITYVVSLGVDAVPDGQIAVTYRLARPSALGGEAGKGSDKTSEIITIIAPSLAVARDLLNSQIERAPNLAHIKVIVVGEELARRGLGDTIIPTIRFREYRGSMFFLVAHRTTAEEVIRTNKPALEKLISRWTEAIMASSADTSYFLHTFLHDFLIDVKASSGSPYAALVGVDPLTGRDRPAAPAVSGERTEEYLPGGTPRRGGNPVVIIGTALFRGDKMVGVLTSEETRMLAILRGEFRSGFLTVEDPLEPAKGVNVHFRQGRNPGLSVNMVDGRAVINVDVMLEGAITSIPSGINYESEEYKRLLEDRMADVIRRDLEKTIRYTQGLGVDPANFGKLLRPKFATYDEYRRFDWEGAYPTATVNVKVTMLIRRTGLMWKTSPIRPLGYFSVCPFSQPANYAKLDSTEHLCGPRSLRRR